MKTYWLILALFNRYNISLREGIVCSSVESCIKDDEFMNAFSSSLQVVQEPELYTNRIAETVHQPGQELKQCKPWEVQICGYMMAAVSSD